MGTEITNNYVNRTYVEPYRTSYSKDPPAQTGAGESPAINGLSADPSAKAELRTYDGERDTHFEEMMRVMDPKAYREFQQIKKATGSTGNLTESMRFMHGWIEDRAIRDPAMERRYEQQKDALKGLKERFGNADFRVEGAGKGDGKEADSEFTVTLTKDELHTLTYGTREEKEALYGQIEDAMKSLTDAEESLEEKFPGFDFGIDTKAEAAKRFFAVLNGETYRGETADGLFEMLSTQITPGKEQ